MSLAEIPLMVLILLFIAAMAAGYFDTLVGGGGLVTVPALLMAGVPPLAALGTNKLQAVFGSGTASFMMFKLGRVKFHDVRWWMAAAFLGSLLGTIAVQYFDSETLKIVIPVVIFCIAMYFIFAGKPKETNDEPRLSSTQYGGSVVPVIGAYDGMFGPGTGSFFVAAGVGLRSQPIIDSTATAKTLNFATNIASLIVFYLYGQLAWAAGLVMIFGQILGARMGAKSLLTINPNLLRVLIIVICVVMLVVWLMNSQSS